MLMKLQIFMTKKFLRWTLIKNQYRQVFLKECQCIEKGLFDIVLMTYY